MLYFWINGLETTEEECFTQQQKVFVSVFSISFSLAGYLIFNSAKSLRVRFRSYTNYRHSLKRVLEDVTRTQICKQTPAHTDIKHRIY